MSEIKISLFKPGRNGKIGVKPYPTDFYTEMSRIKDGSHYAVIKELREITDPIKKREFKLSKLEGFTISASCPTKREAKGAVPSGLLAIDIDPAANPTITDWGEVRDMIFEMPEVVAAFLSASGNGVAFVVKINPKQLKDVFYSIKDELLDNFGLALDPGCHDIVRLRFVSHDHDAKVRDNFDDIPLKTPSFAYLENKRNKEVRVIEYNGVIGSADCDRAWGYAVKSAESRVGMFGDGSKHSFLVALAGFCNTVGMNLDYCETMVQRTYGHLTDVSTERLLKPVRNVYKAYKHKFNTYEKTVVSRRLDAKIVGEVVNNYVRKGIKPTPEIMDEIAQKVEANIEQVEAVVERVVDEYSEEHNAEAKAENKAFKQFWYVDEENAVNISKLAFRDFLLAKGVYRYKVDKAWILIRIENGIVEEIQRDDLKHIVMNYVEALKEFEVWEVLANRVGSVFSDEYLELLPAKEIDFYRDDRESLSLFYLNGVVRMTKGAIDLLPWNEFEGYVWKSKVLERNIELNLDFQTPIKSDIVTFIENVCKRDVGRINALCSSIGYLIHGYKDKANVPAVILNDEVMSDEPEGGTGKGIIADIVARFKKLDIIDGKLFDFGDKFRYQTVNIDTDIIFFDDVEKSFKFQKLFSTLTTGLDVEKKSGLKFKMPFASSPKILIATNYAIQGEGNSNARRKNELEIAQYYSKNFSPFDEFGKLLLDDFTPEEFNAFDNFIIRCCQRYIAAGLIEQELVNQPLKQLYAAVSSEFVTFMSEEYNYTGGQPYRVNQADAYAKYQRLYPSKLGAKTFYFNMEKYYNYFKIPYVRKKSGDDRYFYLGEGV